MQTLRHLLGGTAVTILLWQLLCTVGGWNEALFPSPLRTLAGLGELIASGVLAYDIAASLLRFAVGYLSSVLIALVLGLVLGWYSRIWAYLSPIAQVLRPVSPVAWLPFIVLFFGIGEAPAIAIIFLAAFFPVLLSTVAAVQKIETVYLRVAQNFGIGQPQLFTKILLPAVFPQVATGLHLALGTAWVFLVVMTPNPGQVRCVIPVDRHGRRDRTSADFLHIRDRIFAAFEMKPKDGTEYYI